jgi:hypothetical protein
LDPGLSFQTSLVPAASQMWLQQNINVKNVKSVIMTEIVLFLLYTFMVLIFILIPFLGTGRNKFPNYASQLQATFARSQITEISK